MEAHLENRLMHAYELSGALQNPQGCLWSPAIGMTLMCDPCHSHSDERQLRCAVASLGQAEPPLIRVKGRAYQGGWLWLNEEKDLQVLRAAV